MRNAAILIVAFAATFCSMPQTVHAIDTLINISVWNEADGGNGHTYAILRITKNWTDANALAKTIQLNGAYGNLATVASQEENDFIINNVITVSPSQPSALDQFYLGGVWLQGEWTWQTNGYITFYNWASGEPNNSPGVEIVIAMWGLSHP